MTPVPSQLGQRIRFCPADDGITLAYATVGRGPALVKAANWVSHLEHDWSSSVWRPLLERLAERVTVVRYDERGCGLSDWDATDLMLDAWVRDLEAVVDAVGLERFPLLGISQGGPIAIEYAVRHPERVSRLILAGSPSIARDALAAPFVLGGAAGGAGCRLHFTSPAARRGTGPGLDPWWRRTSSCRSRTDGRRT